LKASQECVGGCVPSPVVRLGANVSSTITDCSPFRAETTSNFNSRRRFLEQDSVGYAFLTDEVVLTKELGFSFFAVPDNERQREVEQLRIIPIVVPHLNSSLVRPSSEYQVHLAWLGVNLHIAHIIDSITGEEDHHSDDHCVVFIELKAKRRSHVRSDNLVIGVEQCQVLRADSGSTLNIIHLQDLLPGGIVVILFSYLVCNELFSLFLLVLIEVSFIVGRGVHQIVRESDDAHGVRGVVVAVQLGYVVMDLALRLEDRLDVVPLDPSSFVRKVLSNFNFFKFQPAVDVIVATLEVDASSCSVVGTRCLDN